MYGHQFFQASVEERVEFINGELKVNRFDSLEDLAEDMFINIGEMKEELLIAGYVFVHQINQFICFK